MRMEGKKTIVTGASRGLGRAIALAFAREGADVLVNYAKREEQAKEVAAAIEGCGWRAVVHRSMSRTRSRFRPWLGRRWRRSGGWMSW